MTIDVQVRRLREREIPQATAMLARAFRDYSMGEFLSPDPSRRDAAMRWLFAASLRYGLRYGEVWAAVGQGGLIEGAAIWWAPEFVEPDDDRAEETGLADGLLVVGPTVWSQLMEASQLRAELHHRVAPDPHWYLDFLGVDLALQGHGIGSALLQPMLDRLDADRLPAYLETSAPRNLDYYPRFGFTLADEVAIPGRDRTFYAMRREPR